MFWKLLKKDKAQKPARPQGQQSQLPVSVLKRLVPVGNLPNVELHKLEVTVTEHSAGSVIFNRGEIPESLCYLLKGSCFLESVDGGGYGIEAETLNAYYPLSNIKEHNCTAIAKSAVTILHLPPETLAKCNVDKRNPLLNSEDIPEHLQHDLFFRVFSEYFKREKLSIPPLPNVAIKLRTAIQKDIGIKEATKIVNMDAIISSKLVRIANSPIYRGVNTINSTLDAVNRLGLTTTRNLVISMSLKNLFKSKNSDLNKRIQMLWKQSVHVSSISYILASLNKRINPDEALLAGLIHNIGAYPIIMFADSHADENFSSRAIDHAMFRLQGILGNITLENWSFPEELWKIPLESENWYHYNSYDLDLCDIVILAKYHSLIGTKQASKLPPIYTLPAFIKLDDQTLTPDVTLQILKDARKQISEAMELFA